MRAEFVGLAGIGLFASILIRRRLRTLQAQWRVWHVGRRLMLISLAFRAYQYGSESEYKNWSNHRCFFLTSLTKRRYSEHSLEVKEWLVRHGPFEAVIDGANVGLFKQKQFSFSQLDSVVKGIQKMSSSNKLPLIVMHNHRVRGGPAESPKNKILLESWRRSGALYATPIGSSDDWYWLYAAVSYKCLLVTNDEMRDHLFELLGTNFFPHWKEKHQVRFAFSRKVVVFNMPPPYSVVIQESEAGTWHVPVLTDDDVEANRQWICATRSSNIPSTEVHVVKGR